MSYTLHCGDCLDILPTIPVASVDAVICDPPYPEISREYGRMTEDEWWTMMMGVCAEVRRVLKPSGSAVFILQPNSRKVGSMRGWLWRFMWWVTTDWNMVQDAYWWNYTALPLCGSNTAELMRPSVKPCVWAGPDDCHRNQSAVLWAESDWNATRRAADRASGREARIYTGPSGRSVNTLARNAAAEKRGGVTPFNLIPVQTDGFRKAGGALHGAVTPLALADWWTRYIVPPGGTVLDCFNGAGTMGVAALQNGAHYIGIEKMAKYVDVSYERLAKGATGAYGDAGMTDTVSTLAQKLRPFWLRDVASTVATVPVGGSSSGDARYVLSTRMLTAGDGLTGGGDLTADRTFHVGVAGLGLGIGANAVTLVSTNNPGAAASVLATDAAGLLILQNGMFTQAAGSTALFASGFAGSGWRVDYGITSVNKASLEVDDLTVRGRMRVYELLIQQIRATNGSVFVSSASKAVEVSGSVNPLWTVNAVQLTFNGDNATFTAGIYTISTVKTTGATDTDGGSNDRRNYHGFLLGDVIRAQQVRWDGANFAGVIQSNIEVTSVTNLYTYGAAIVDGDVPAVGYDYVRLGNIIDTNRQGAVYLTADDSAAPFIDIVDGVRHHSDWNSAGVKRVRLGKLTGISDARFGGPLSGYGLYADNVYLRGQMVVTGGSLGGLAAADVNANTTTIDGGHITANSIAAYQLVANSVTAEKIAANTITAEKIAAGAITGDKMDLTSYLAINTNEWQGPGIQLQYNNGAPRAYIGNGSTKYLEFDGAELTVRGTIDITGGVISGPMSTTGSIYAGDAAVRLSTDGIRLKLETDTSPNILTSNSAVRWMPSIIGGALEEGESYCGYVAYKNTSTTPDVLDLVLTSVVGDDDDTAFDARVVLQAGHYAGETYTDAYLIVTREAGAGARTINAGCDSFNAEATITAYNYVDYTPFYDGDAVAELKQIRGAAGRGEVLTVAEIDHATLPAFARKRIVQPDKTEREGRDLGAMISILTVAVQQLDARLDALEGK